MPIVGQRLRRVLPSLFFPPRPNIDPFRTLELQTRLSRLAAALERLDRAGPERFALAFHVNTTLMAYAATLDEACALMALPLAEGCDPVRRLLAEGSLRAAGWDW